MNSARQRISASAHGAAVAASGPTAFGHQRIAPADTTTDTRQPDGGVNSDDSDSYDRRTSDLRPTSINKDTAHVPKGTPETRSPSSVSTCICSERLAPNSALLAMWLDPQRPFLYLPLRKHLLPSSWYLPGQRHRLSPQQEPGYLALFVQPILDNVSQSACSQRCVAPERSLL